MENQKPKPIKQMENTCQTSDLAQTFTYVTNGTHLGSTLYGYYKMIVRCKNTVDINITHWDLCTFFISILILNLLQAQNHLCTEHVNPILGAKCLFKTVQIQRIAKIRNYLPIEQEKYLPTLITHATRYNQMGKIL